MKKIFCSTDRFRVISDIGAGLYRSSPGLLILIMILSLSACATPIGVNKMEMREAYNNIRTNALNSDSISVDTTILLKRYDLLKSFEKDTGTVIALLHEKARQDQRSDILFALAELSFYHGESLRKKALSGNPEAASDYFQIMKATPGEERFFSRDYFLMSAFYAYQYLLRGGSEDSPGTYDHRLQIAGDLYNRALVQSLATGKDDQLEFKSGIRRLPVGEITITFIKESLGSELEDFQSFLAADDYAVRGLTVRNRTAGLGSPLIAVKNKTEKMPRGQALPVTAFLQVEGDVNALSDKTAKAFLGLYPIIEETEITVNGRKVPLQSDSTTPIAYQLNDAPIWDLGLQSFLSPGKQKSELFMIQPYQRGRIPVIFVHGTASSPVWWGEMWNTLSADPILRKHYQFAFFFYNSSLPIVSSASDLRTILSDTVSRFDPQGQDPALQQMVVIGHSQGGLLTKLSVVKPADVLWRSVSDKDFKDLKTPPAMKSMLRKWMFFEPLPFVKRVVYIATPFRGSFRAQGWVRGLIQRVVSLPINILSLPADIVKKEPNVISDLLGQTKLPLEVRKKMPTSVDGMSHKNPVLQTLAKMPVASGVKAHSIIAIDGDELPPNGDDGVVEYKSAQQDGVESEYIVRSFHSCQGHPLTIEEVRRILLEHLESLSTTSGIAGIGG